MGFNSVFKGLRYSVGSYMCYVQSAWQTTKYWISQLQKFKAALDSEFPKSP